MFDDLEGSEHVMKEPEHANHGHDVSPDSRGSSRFVGAVVENVDDVNTRPKPVIRPPAHFDDYIVYSAVTRTSASTQLVDSKTRALVDQKYIVPQELKQSISNG